MVLVTKATLKSYHKRPILGATSIVGGSLWSRVKDFAKKVIGSKTVKDTMKTFGSMVLKQIPGLVDKGLTTIGPKLPRWIPPKTADILRGLTKKSVEGLEKTIHKRIDPEIPAFAFESAPRVATNDSGEKETLGFGIAKMKPGAGTRAQKILQRIMK